MKTIVIWDTCGEDHIKFFILDGNYTHLDRVYINLDSDQDKQDELNALMYDNNNNIKVKLYDNFQELIAREVEFDSWKVIVAGFAP